MNVNSVDVETISSILMRAFASIANNEKNTLGVPKYSGEKEIPTAAKL